MKNVKKLIATLLAGACIANLTACELPFDLPFLNGGNDDGETVKVEKITSDLLDGKVANLLSANGVGIQNKETEQSETAVATTQRANGLIRASADGPTMKQPVHELVKSAKDGIHDVRFHKKEKGSYRDWNKKFGKHHHNKQECPKTDCDDISDEIQAEEEQEQTPTILSMGARVNKLYNGGEFTFVCISSEVEGEAKLLTESTVMEHVFMQRALIGQYPTLINITDNVEGRFNLTALHVGSGEDAGIILVKRAVEDEGYHQANYWSDDYNQSYVIDNATGKTYSLAQFPYIYSVTGNVFTVWTGTQSKTFDYYTVAIENDELQFTKLQLPESGPYTQFLNQNALVDIYGNVVFQTRTDVASMAQTVGVTLEGEDVLSEELRFPDNPQIIFAGFNQLYFKETIHLSNPSLENARLGMYRTANRYFKGTDEKIYRVGFIGSYDNIPVHVLNENGEWTTVPQTTSVTFAPYSGYITQIYDAPHGISFFTLNSIHDGYAYFSNATWGEPAGFLHLGYDLHQIENEPVGVIKTSVEGSVDEELKSLTAKLKEQGEERVYRVDNESMVYKDGTELVLWNRKTNVRESIEIGDAEITIHPSASFFVIAEKFIPFNGIDFAWTLETLPTTPPNKFEVQLEAFYTLLKN